MYRLALCLFFIATLPNASLTSAEESTTTAPETQINAEVTNTTVTTEPPKQNDTVTEASKTKTGAATALPIEGPKSTTEISKQTNSTTESNLRSAEENKVTTKEIKATTEKPGSNSTKETEQEKELRVAFETLIDEGKFRMADSPNGTTAKQEPSYISKVTGSLVMPALKARHSITKGLTRSQQGVKDWGSGTYQAASGAMSFLKDATKAVYNSG